MGENLKEIPPDFLSVGKILVENKAQKTDVADFQRRGQKRRRKARKGEERRVGKGHFILRVTRGASDGKREVEGKDNYEAAFGPMG